MSARDRFVLTSSGAVLDPQTGLSWEPTPLTAAFPWAEAGRQDPAEPWRLPTIGELMDLLTRLPAPPFPAPEPGTVFWSASESPFASRDVVRVALCEPSGSFVVCLRDKRSTARRWRVRDVPLRPPASSPPLGADHS